MKNTYQRKNDPRKYKKMWENTRKWRKEKLDSCLLFDKACKNWYHLALPMFPTTLLHILYTLDTLMFCQFQKQLVLSGVLNMVSA